MTPRATMSTRVLLTTFMITQIFSTPGLLRISFVRPAAFATLGKKWALKSGEVYDRSYAGRFFRFEAVQITTRIANERESQGKPRPTFDTQELPNRQTLIVNLLIELKN